jgi:hypothetical protein
MALFVDAISDIQQPGVFALELASPLVVEGIPNGYIGYSFQAPWGPVKTAYLPTSQGDMIATYFPPGSPHTSTGYYGIVRRKKFNSVMVRVLGGSAGLLPPIITGITHGGTPGTTSYSYRVTAVNAAGETIGSQTVTTATGAATLNSTDNNVIAWGTVTGAVSYNVYRTAAAGTPNTTGKINASPVMTTTFTDTGLSASGSVPTSNTSGYTQAVCYLLDASNVAVAELVAIYPGTLANTALTAQVAAASDGVANHFDLIVTLSDATTGSTSERFPNLQTQATSILPNTATSRLLASFSLINTPSTRPANATYTFAGGSDGSAVAATDYDAAFGQLDLRDDVDVYVTDDVGDSIRSAVNSDLLDHVALKTDRIAMLQGPPSQTLSAALTDKANYVSDRIRYVGNWVTVLDDQGNVVTSPAATFMASAYVNLEPQQSPAWWADQVTDFYTGINSILSPQFSSADDGTQKTCTQAGITLVIRRPSGRYAFLNDRTTSSNINFRFGVTRRIKDFLAKSWANALDPYVNGPNLPTEWQQIKIGLDNFNNLQVLAGRLIAVDPVDIVSGNNNTTQTAGQFIFKVTGKSPTVMEQIIAELNVGPGVTGVTFQ